MWKIRRISENFIQYFCKHLTGVLLFAVLLSAGFMVNSVTRAKYVSYVNAAVHSVADVFYFSSNYLGNEEEGVTYEVSSWDRDNYEIKLKIQNFENALLYNDADTGCYYHVDAVIYEKDGSGNFTKRDMGEDGFEVTVSYGSAETKTYQGRQYAFLHGLEVTEEKPFRKNDGTQIVTVSLVADEKVMSDRYLEIKAYTMTATQMEEAAQSEEETDWDWQDVPKGPVFETRLSAGFLLKMKNDAMITTNLQQSHTSSEVVYDLKCTGTDGGAFSLVRIYYDKTKVKFEDAYEYTVKTSEENSNFDYIELEVYATSITKLRFFKRRMADEISSEEYTDACDWTKQIYYETLKDEE